MRQKHCTDADISDFELLGVEIILQFLVQSGPATSRDSEYQPNEWSRSDPCPPGDGSCAHFSNGGYRASCKLQLPLLPREISDDSTGLAMNVAHIFPALGYIHWKPENARKISMIKDISSVIRHHSRVLGSPKWDF